MVTPNPKRQGKEGDGLLVIHAGLFRTGTASMTEAYRQLGYSVHHGIDDKFANPYDELERAAEATWPALANLPDYTYKPPSGTAAASSKGPVPRPRFMRADWEETWKGYDVVTDLASPFALELIEAFPEAKVVVVERDFDRWWPSMKSQVLEALYHTWSGPQQFIAYNILGLRAIFTMRKIHAGFYGCPEFSLESIEARARQTHKEYHRRVREAVPLDSGRRLEFRLSDGWGPLCEFLGKEVPDSPFPRLNDRGNHAKGRLVMNMILVAKALAKVTPVLAVLAGSYAYWSLSAGRQP